ncbi:MAG: hypothetical protein PQJ47_04100, partial [Sphaerochaetaceae bacterium]|nr:hypothetical protein [Sphaerochaetaceae bacterium]
MNKEYRLTQRKGRSVQVMYSGTDRWISTGQKDVRTAELWAEANKKVYILSGGDAVKLKNFATDFWTRTDPKSIRKRHERLKKTKTELYYVQMNGRVKNYINPALGHHRLTDITSGMVEDWFLSLKKLDGGEMADDTKNKCLDCLSLIFDEAERRGLCESNPCGKVEKISVEHKECVPFSAEEMGILFPENDVEAVEVWGTLKWTCFFHIMRSTGFRPGEIAGLQRSDFYPELAGIYTTSSVNSYERKIVERIKT